MIDRNQLEHFIINEHECEYLDYKAKTYGKKGSTDLLKDIIAMANASHNGSKYIILGVKDDMEKGKLIIGISNEDKVDSASYQQYILNNIEPDINLDIYYIEYNNKNIGVIEIKDTDDKPYMLKKQNDKLQAGYCLIRKGSQQSIATRKDFDNFYSNKDKFEVRLLGQTLRGVDLEHGCALLHVVLTNLTINPVTIMSGSLQIYLTNEKILELPIYGLNEFVGADFKLELQPKSEKVGDFYIGFGSTECLVLNLDEYGYTDNEFKFQLNLYDVADNCYSTILNGCSVFARGNFLWKVKKRRGRVLNKV